MTVNLLGWRTAGWPTHSRGSAPAPGGPFTLGAWQEERLGTGARRGPGWLGARLAIEPQTAGWSLLVRAVIEHVELGPGAGDGMLGHVRGRYRAVSLRSALGIVDGHGPADPPRADLRQHGRHPGGPTSGVELDDVGHGQVAEAARGWPPSRSSLVSSPLRRCRQTLQALAAARARRARVAVERA